MKQVISFLNDLQQNNNRQWFEEHKSEYQAAIEVFNSFTQELIAGISAFDQNIKNLTIKDCTYRIYRDIRFSNNKLPYKTHMGAFIAPHGKKGGYSGYYFHIEAQGADYIGGHMLSTGIYCPDQKVIKSIREEILLNGNKFVEAVNIARNFTLDRRNALKKVPAGFPGDSEYAEYFKLRDYFLAQSLDDDFIMSGNLLNNTLREFKKTLVFNNLMNQSVAYAYESD